MCNNVCIKMKNSYILLKHLHHVMQTGDNLMLKDLKC